MGRLLEANAAALETSAVRESSRPAIIHMTKMRVVEWAERGIRVNGVAPGTVDGMLLGADLRKPAEYDAVMSAAFDHFGGVDILINNAGLSFTYIWPDLGRRTLLPRSWEASDDIVQAVMNTNSVAADQMVRRFDADAWDAWLPTGVAAARASRPAGFALRPVDDLDV